MKAAGRISSKSLAAVFGVALGLRLCFCFVVVPLFELPLGPAEEDFYTSADGYVPLAVNLYEHQRLAFAPDQPSTIFRLPAFPAAIAAALALTNDVGVATLLVNCFASAATAAIVYLMASLVLDGRAWLVRYAAALLPQSIYGCPSSYSDTFIAFALLLHALLLLRLLLMPSVRNAIVSGLAFVLAALTKPVLVPFTLVFVAYVALRRRTALKCALLSALVGVAGTGLWTVRNYYVSGKFVPISTGAGFNLLVGTFMLDESTDCMTSFKYAVRQTFAELTAATGRAWRHEDYRPAGHFDVSPELDRLCRELAWRKFSDDPLLLPRKLAVNAARFWYFSSSPTKSVVSALLNFPLLVLAGIALWRYHRRNPVAIEFVVLFVLSYVGVYSLIITHSMRFAVPVLMLLAPFAGQTLHDLGGAAWARRAGARTDAVAAGGGAAPSNER